MSLRARLFLILGSLVAVLALAHGLLVHSLTEELDDELGAVALDVGAAVAQLVARTAPPMPPLPSPPSCATPPCPREERSPEERQVQVHVEERVLTQRGGEAAGKQTQESRVVRHIVYHPAGTQEPGTQEPGTGGPPGFAYVYKVGGAPAPGALAGEPGEADPAGGLKREMLVIRLGDGAKGALQLQGPNLSAEVPIPRVGMQEKLATFERRMFVGSLILLLIGLLAAAYLAHRVSAPLLRLANAAIAVGGGAFGTTVDEKAGSSELRQALVAFNRMSRHLGELSERNRRLEQERHLGEIGEIARGLAHSLRNPLHALGLSIEEMAARDPEKEALATAARRQIGRLDRNIRSFLVFASQADIEPRRVDVGALAEDVALEALQDQHRGLHIEVVSDNEGGNEGGSEQNLELEAVEPELRAMLQALVINAVEASPPGGRVRIHVGRGEPAEKIVFEVDDEGEGLAPEIRRRLFTPHLTTKTTGSGMGLFLAQRLAASRYEGKIELVPRPEGGTRARLELGPRVAIALPGTWLEGAEGSKSLEGAS